MSDPVGSYLLYFVFCGASYFNKRVTNHKVFQQTRQCLQGFRSFSRQGHVFRVFDQVQHKGGFSKKMARGLKFCILGVEVLFYLFRKNKGADQLHDYSTADLYLGFSHGKAGFLMHGSNISAANKMHI